MKNKKHSAKTIITTLVFTIIWFTAVNIIFTLPALDSNNKHPNVQVHLTKHLIGLNGISESDTGNLSWSVIEDVRVVGRYDGYVEFSSDHQAYVDLDKTVLKDSLNDQLVLSKEEIDSLLINICSGKASELEIENIPHSVYGLLPSAFTVDVKGRYEGVIALTTNRLIPETETNITQVLKGSPVLPWASICGCLVSSVLIAAAVYISMCKFSKSKLCIPVIGIVMVLFLTIAYFFAGKMK